jgi:YD repeat-containing protein
VDVGTNGGTAYARPATVPAASDTVLVTATAYNAAGWAQSVTDPRGIVTQTTYDNLGRTTKTIEDYTNGTPTNSSDKTTEYTYDGMGHTLTVKADLLPSGAHQTTQYVYGFSYVAIGQFYSNDLLSAVYYPDPTTGNPSSSQQEQYNENALGEIISKTDRNGNNHAYTFDVLGRETVDSVTFYGQPVDTTVGELTIAYDTGGRPYLYTSYDATYTNIVNQVQDVYNGLGQLITEYQATTGAVNTSTTPKVQYAYSEMVNSANHSRLISMSYPNGRVLNYNYNRVPSQKVVT